MNSGPKYLVCDGWVRSKNDGDSHFISTGRLSQLYGLRLGDWVSDKSPMYKRMSDDERKKLIALHPRYDGNYRLPE